MQDHISNTSTDVSSHQCHWLLLNNQSKLKIQEEWENQIVILLPYRAPRALMILETQSRNPVLKISFLVTFSLLYSRIQNTTSSFRPFHPQYKIALPPPACPTPHTQPVSILQGPSRYTTLVLYFLSYLIYTFLNLIPLIFDTSEYIPIPSILVLS